MFPKKGDYKEMCGLKAAQIYVCELGGMNTQREIKKLYNSKTKNIYYGDLNLPLFDIIIF